VSGPILDFWNRNGGLSVFGLPLSPQQEEYIGLLTPTAPGQWLPGQRLQVQRFERNRLEIQPDGSTVTVGRLGADILSQQGRDWQFFDKSQPQPGCQFFEATGHNICGAMLDAWNRYGGLELVGLPLSGEQRETLENGEDYVVQWFERARFQITPGVGVQLGRLGALDLCSSVPSPVNAEMSPSNCVIQGVRMDAVLSGFAPNAQVNTWLVTPGGEVLPPALVDFSPTVDENGQASIYIPSPADTLGGVEYAIFQQADGRHTAIQYLKVINPEFTPFDTATLHPCTGLPKAANAEVWPAQSRENRDRLGDLTTCAIPGIDYMAIDAIGFVPDETVTVVVTGPDGRQYPEGEPVRTNATGDGVIETGLNVTAYRATPGLYTAFIQGTVPQCPSNVPHIAAVPIMVTNSDAPILAAETETNTQSEGPNPCATVPASINATLRPSNCVPAGTQLEIDVFGFQPNEQVGFWITDPDQSVNGTVETVNIGSEGAVFGIPIDTTGVTQGIWAMTFRGVESGHQSVAYFRVLAPDAAPPDSSNTATLNVINDSPQTICYVNFSLSTDTSWGPDRLGSTETIGPGASRAFETEPGIYDMRLLDCDQNVLFTQFRINLSGTYELRYTGS
jgi:hypothetical protein